MICFDKRLYSRFSPSNNWTAQSTENRGGGHGSSQLSGSYLLKPLYLSNMRGFIIIDEGFTLVTSNLLQDHL